VGVQTLFGVGGLQGFGGQWPASIWRTFAEDEFTKLPIESFPTPDFGGTAWDLMPAQPQPAASATPTQCNGNGNGNGNGFGRHCNNGGNNNNNGGNNGGQFANPAPNPTPTQFTVIPSLPVATPPQTGAAAVKLSSRG